MCGRDFDGDAGGESEVAAEDAVCRGEVEE